MASLTRMRRRVRLTGKIFDEGGEPLYAQGAAKGKRRYRYYVSRSIVRGDSNTPEEGWRISAPEIEQTVSAAAIAMLDDESAVSLALENSGTNSDRLSCALNSAQSWLERLQSASESAAPLAELVTRVDISREGMQLLLELPIATSRSDEKSQDHISLSRVFPMEMKRRGIEMRMVLHGDCKPSRFDRPLIKASLAPADGPTKCSPGRYLRSARLRAGSGSRRATYAISSR